MRVLFRAGAACSLLQGHVYNFTSNLRSFKRLLDGLDSQTVRSIQKQTAFHRIFRILFCLDVEDILGGGCGSGVDGRDRHRLLSEKVPPYPPAPDSALSVNIYPLSLPPSVILPLLWQQGWHGRTSAAIYFEKGQKKKEESGRGRGRGCRYSTIIIPLDTHIHTHTLTLIYVYCIILRGGESTLRKLV